MKGVKKIFLLLGGWGILIGSLCWWTWTQTQTKVLGTSTQLNANRIIQLINIERAKKGAAGVAINDKLNEAALKKASRCLHKITGLM